MERVHREPLQPRDLNWLLVVTMHHTGAFTQHLYRTRARTAGAKDVRIEDGARRAGEIATGDLLYEARHINVCRTSGCAGRIKAVETAIRLSHGSLPLERRVQITEALNHLRLRRDLFMERSSFHWNPIWKSNITLLGAPVYLATWK
jgi:hypothetical protein